MEKQGNETIYHIFRTNLNVKPSEKVLVFSDEYNKDLKKIGKKITAVGKDFTNKIVYSEFPPTDCHGTEPQEGIWRDAFGSNSVQMLIKESLLQPCLTKRVSTVQMQEIKHIISIFKNEAVHVIIALSYFSTSHTIFRDLLNEVCKARYASMPLFDESMLTGAMTVDWNSMAKRIKMIVQRLNNCESIDISTPQGTRLRFSARGRTVHEDTGLITKPGSFGNLPAGEVFLAPIEGSAEGRLVLEWAPTRKLKRPVCLTINKGNVTKIEGDEEYADFLHDKLSEDHANSNIAEFGIGTNDRASRPDNILEAEKIMGTVHIALGDNSSFGGSVRTSFHQDFVFFEPTVTLVYTSGNRDRFIKNGKVLNSG